MLLERHELDHPVWLKIKAHLEARIQSLREQNDSLNLTDEQTSALRGRIAEDKELLRLGEEPIKWEE